LPVLFVAAFLAFLDLGFLAVFFSFLGVAVADPATGGTGAAAIGAFFTDLLTTFFTAFLIFFEPAVFLVALFGALLTPVGFALAIIES
jgi:hypothetical protein